MRLRILLVVFAALLLGVGAVAVAAEPIMMSCQGVLKDDTGGVVPDGDYSVVFRLYADSTGSDLLWEETQTAVEVKDGLFDVRLGSNSLLDIVAMRMGLEPTPFLEVRVSGDDPMVPRSRLLSVPQAALAQRLDGDLETREGSLLLRTTAGDSAISLAADSITGVISVEIGFPPDPAMPAIGMLWDGTSEVTQMKLGHPPDPTAPAIELVTRPAGPSSDEAKIHVGDLNAPEVDIGVVAAGGRIGLNLGGAAPTEAIDMIGNVQVAGVVCADNIACPSDARLKENARPIVDALACLEGLRGVRFDWSAQAIAEKHLADRPQIGLVAQEVEAVVPEVVLRRGDGYRAIDYSRLVPVLIEAIKEQRCRIEALQDRIRDLEGEM